MRVKAECPNCKAPARRRDLIADEKMDRVAALYARLEAATGQMGEIGGGLKVHAQSVQWQAIGTDVQLTRTPPLENRATDVQVK